MFVSGQSLGHNIRHEKLLFEAGHCYLLGSCERGFGYPNTLEVRNRWAEDLLGERMELKIRHNPLVRPLPDAPDFTSLGRSTSIAKISMTAPGHARRRDSDRPRVCRLPCSSRMLLIAHGHSLLCWAMFLRISETDQGLRLMACSPNVHDSAAALVQVGTDAC